MRSTLSISYLILRRRVSAVSKDAPQARTILRPRLIDRAQHPEAVPLGVQLEVAVGHRVGPGRRAPEAAQRVDVDAGDAAVRVVGLVAARSSSSRSGAFTVISLATLRAWRVRKRMEGPTPQALAWLISVLMVARPGTPMWIGRRLPAARMALSQALIGAASKQKWGAM